MSLKTWRFDVRAECETALYIDAETQEEAEAILAIAPESNLKNATSIINIKPDKSTLQVISVRESTGDNP